MKTTKRRSELPMTKIHDLSDDLLDNILSRVKKPWSKLGSKHVSLVCRKWYESDRVLRQELRFGMGSQKQSAVPPKRLLGALLSRFANLTFLDIMYRDYGQHRKEQVDDDCLRSLTECVKLTKVRLDSCKQVTNAGIENLALCPGLTFVCLLSLPRISERGLLSLLTRCHSLKDLYLSGLKNVRGAEWLEFVGMHCQVESLGISYCNGVKESKLFKLGRRGWGNLREFSYSRSFREDDFEPMLRAWRFFGPEDTEYCPNLETLKLVNCLSMSRMGVLSILGQCTSLREVQIEHCAGCRDEDVDVLARNNPHLSSLFLSIDCYALSQTVTNISLVHIAENLRWLKTLLLFFAHGEFEPLVLESGLVAIVERCARLDFLSLGYIPCVKDRLMTAIGHSASLREVQLSECEHLTDEMVLLMGSNLTSLQLIECPLLTDRCLTGYRTSPRGLAKLRIMSCPGITREAAIEVGEDTWFSSP